MQNKYNISIWFYRPSAIFHHQPNDAKVERLEKNSNFVKGCGNLRILVWDEHCALIKNMEVLLERPNTKHAEF